MATTMQRAFEQALERETTDPELGENPREKLEIGCRQAFPDSAKRDLGDSGRELVSIYWKTRPEARSAGMRDAMARIMAGERR